MSREKILNTIAKSNASIISNLDSQRIRDKKTLKDAIDYLFNDKKYTLVDATYQTTYEDVVNFIKYINENTSGRVDFRFYGSDQLEIVNDLLSKVETSQVITRSLTEIKLLESGELNNEKVSFWKATNLEKSPINYIDLIYNTGVKNTSIISLIVVLKG